MYILYYVSIYYTYKLIYVYVYEHLYTSMYVHMYMSWNVYKYVCAFVLLQDYLPYTHTQPNRYTKRYTGKWKILSYRLNNVALVSCRGSLTVTN